MEKILRKLIEYGLRGVDTYTHNGSTWLIFTDNKQWVIELTENKTLWYNYNFFKQLFCVATDDVIENQKHITKWVENNLINKKPTCVTHFRDARDRKQQFEDTLENGVKETSHNATMFQSMKVEDTIQNGVKETIECDWADPNQINEVIREGVKETSHRQYLKTYDVKDTTQDGTEHDRWILDGCDDPIDEVLDNGVKITASLQSREYTGDIDEVLGDGVRTSHPRQYVGENIIYKIIDKGVIETHDDVYHHKGRIDGVIKNGVKETINWSDSIDGDLNQNGCIDNVINDGVKETKTPGWDGDIISTVEWLNENNSTSYPKMINDVIENGVKETVAAGYTDPKTNILYIKWGTQIDEIIKEGEKINGTYAGGQSEKCKSVVEYGTKNPTD